MLTRVVGSLGLVALPLAAQDLRFHYPAPAPGAVTVMRDIPYGTAGGTALRMDVYRPAAGKTAPGLVFFNRAVGPERAHVFYTGWARTAAAQGLVAIVPDLRSREAGQDFRLLIAHLVGQGTRYGLDSAAIAVWAGSANVTDAFPLVEDPTMKAVKSAVMVYGSADVKHFRRDLPVLYVRAGLDRSGADEGLVALATRAVEQNAPLTLFNHPFGHHAFEIIDDDAGTRDAIERMIDFVRRTTSPGYQAALRRSLPPPEQ